MNENFVSRLLSYLSIPHTKWYLDKIMNNQPYGDSLYGLLYILEKYNINASCLEIEEPDDFQPNIMPIVAMSDDIMVMATQVQIDTIKYFTAKDKTIREISKSDAAKHWDKAVLKIDTNRYTKEPNLREHALYEKKVKILNSSLIIGIVFLYISAIIHTILKDSTITFILAIINGLGCYISWLLLQSQLHIPNKAVNKLCNIIDNSNCSAVTESKGATVMGLFKLSELCAGYFLVNEICLLIFPGVQLWIALIALMILPLSIWSIWYQKKVVKQWCPLCLMTIIIMWLQVIVVILSHISIGSLNILYGTWLVSFYLISIIGIHKLMKLLENFRQNNTRVKELEAIKSDKRIIQSILGNCISHNYQYVEGQSLIFGNYKAENTIVIVSNPICKYCAEIHKFVKDLPSDDIKIVYILACSPKNNGNLNKYVIAIYQQLGQDAAWRIITELFSGQYRPSKAGSSIPINVNDPLVESEYERQMDWINKMHISGTPIEFINGRQLKWPYTIKDYAYLTR